MQPAMPHAPEGSRISLVSKRSLFNGRLGCSPVEIEQADSLYLSPRAPSVALLTSSYLS